MFIGCLEFIPVVECLEYTDSAGSRQDRSKRVFALFGGITLETLTGPGVEKRMYSFVD